MGECPRCGRTGTHVCPPGPSLSELLRDALARAEVAEKKLADVMAKGAELYEEGKRIAHASEAIVRRAEAAERRADKWPGIAERLAEALSEHMVLCRLCYYGGREQVPDVCDAECPEYEKCTSYHAFAAHEARVKE